jgi:signal transduction histidine kinase
MSEARGFSEVLVKSSVSYPILTAQVRFEQDIVQVRQKARQIAAGLGFDSQAQTRIATAVSEIARNAFKYAGGGKVEFIVEGESPQIFRTRISDTGPGIADLPAVLSPNFRSANRWGTRFSSSKTVDARGGNRFGARSRHGCTIN